MRFLTPVESARIKLISDALLARLSPRHIDRWRLVDPRLGKAAADVREAYRTDDDDLAVTAGDILRSGLPKDMLFEKQS